MSKETHCKSCLHKIECHTAIENDDKPTPGDYSVCLYCGKISFFDNDLNLVGMTEAQINELKESDPGSYNLLLKCVYLISNRIKAN